MGEHTATVVFMPSGRRGEFVLGTPLLEAARRLGVDIDSVCGGRGLCGRCQILCTEGDFPKLELTSSQTSLSEFSETEAKFEARKGPLNNRRLSCHARIEGPLVIDVPPESQVHKQVVRKEIDARDIVVNPSLRMHYVEVDEASLADPRGDLERTLDALKQEWQLSNLRLDPNLLPGLQKTLRAAEWKITVAVTDHEIIAINPGFQDCALGVAIDVGSTTIAAHLCELSTGAILSSGGRMNPQIRFGEDLMSRVSYVMMHPEGATEMTEIVREAISDLIGEVCHAGGQDTRNVLSLVIAGNPIMHHLVLGLDPTELGFAPFALAVDSAQIRFARELGLDVHPGAKVYIPPSIAGHVGADCAAMLIAQAPFASEPISLLIDIGTNAEIVLGNKDKLLACSSPTGPAFEGAQISFGQRATAGAIERVRIHPKTLDVRVKVIGVEAWSDEAGFSEGVADTGITGICGSGIIEAVGEMYLAQIIRSDGQMSAQFSGDSLRVRPGGEAFEFVLIEAREGQNEIVITQNDVRQVQLAKSALYAGIRLLMDAYPVKMVDRIEIAGAFGSNIDPKYAMLLGLIPDCELSKVKAIGNAVSTGTRILLLDQAARAELESQVAKIEKIETAIAPDFQQHFVAAMAIPHQSDPFDHLFSVVTRPDTNADKGTQKARRRRSSRSKRGSGSPD